MIGQSAGMLFYPYFSKAISEKKEYLIKEKITQYERFVFLFVMPAMLFLAIYSHTLVMVLLGEKYIYSIPVLTIITLAQFVYLLNIPYGNLLAGMGYFKLGAIINLIFVILFAVLLIFFVHPRYLDLSEKGAAYAFFLSNVSLASMFVFFARKKLDVFNVKRYLNFLSFGLLAFLLFSFIYNKLIL